jgi:Ring finger domain
MNSNYETLYGVGLLDDLHNYFPALLYDSSGFGSVRDVLAYVHQQTRNRFDLFSYGQREYQSRHPPRAPSEFENSSYRRVVRTSFSSMPPQALHPLSTLLRQPPVTIPSPATGISSEPQSNNPNEVNQSTLRTTVPNIQVELNSFLNESNEEEEDEQPIQETHMITNALLSLLNIPTTGLTRTYDIDAFGALLGRGRNMDQFLQPVVVHPTPEQIEQNTTLGNLVSDTDHACAICQDALTSEQQGRKLNACGHWFHKSCIDTWLERDVHCPVCRHDIREPMRQTTPAEEQN